MSFLTNIFKGIFKLLARLWNFIKKYLPYILIAVALCFYFFPLMAFTIPAFSLAGFTATSATVISGMTGVVLSLGAALLIAPGETADAVATVADGVGEAASGVVDAAGEVATDVLSTMVDVVTSSPIGLAALGLAAYFLFFGSKDEKKTILINPSGRSLSSESSGVTSGADDGN